MGYNGGMTILRSCMLRRNSARILLALTLVCLTTRVCAQPQAPESTLKAAIIINMLMFVDWPQQGNLPAGQLQICYLDNSPVANALEHANGKSIRGKTVNISKRNADNLANCHALYLSSANRAMLPAILAALRTLPVLLVGDSPDYFQQGIMLNLDQAANRIVFDVNLQSARKAGLLVSSKALRLARQVIE